MLVWAAIWHGGRSRLRAVDGTMTGQKYRDEILLPHVVPIVQDENLTFQQDNATPHRARIVCQFLEEHGVPTLPWPARSPDLSPIEHAWDLLGRGMREAYHVPPPSLNVLRLRLIEQWNRIDQRQIDELCDSMPQRLAACVSASGGHTRF